MITEDYVRRIFKGLEQGDGASFFEHVDDKVDWIVEGTHPALTRGSRSAARSSAPRAGCSTDGFISNCHELQAYEPC
jgi:ketosteroid isomerase-like protein